MQARCHALQRLLYNRAIINVDRNTLTFPTSSFIVFIINSMAPFDPTTHVISLMPNVASFQYMIDISLTPVKVGQITPNPLSTGV